MSVAWTYSVSLLICCYDHRRTENERFSSVVCTTRLWSKVKIKTSHGVWESVYFPANEADLLHFFDLLLCERNTVFCHMWIKNSTLSAYGGNKYSVKEDRFFFLSLKTSRKCGNTLNSPTSDSRLPLWEKSTYFLSVRLAICLLEGLLSQSTCCCMCSQPVSPKKSVELSVNAGAEKVFLWRWSGAVCVHVHACVSVILFWELSK